MELVLGIDLGTSYFKLGVFDRSGELRGLTRVAVETNNGDGLLCELPTQRFWGVLQKGVKQTLNQANAQAVDIKAMGYSSKANTFVLLDAEDKPLSPLVFWTDGRAKEIFPEVKQLWQRQSMGQAKAQGSSFCCIR